MKPTMRLLDRARELPSFIRGGIPFTTPRQRPVDLFTRSGPGAAPRP